MPCLDPCIGVRALRSLMCSCCCCCCNPQQCRTQHDIRATNSGGGEIPLPAGAKAPRLHTFARSSRNKLPRHEAMHAEMDTWGLVLRCPELRYWHPGHAQPTHYNYGGKVAMKSHYPSAQMRCDYFLRKVFLRTSRNRRNRSWGLCSHSANPHSAALSWPCPTQINYGGTAAVKSCYLSA